MTLALLILAFLAGAWVALVIRALVAEHAHRRMQDAAVAALNPSDLERLRGYIAMVDEAERDRVALKRDGGSTVIRLP